MRGWLLSLGLLAGLLALAACAAKEEAKPAPAPAAVGAEAKAAWEQEWERLLAAAKREGKVVVNGPAGSEFRRALTEPFEKKYGISVEFKGTRGAELVPQLEAERKAGQYLWDVYVGGTATPMTSLKPMGALEPLEPAFVLPEVKDPKSWRDGKLPFLDKERYVLAALTFTMEAFIFNPTLVKPGDIRAYRDLLDPKWKGKIAARDPSVSGSGNAKFGFFYLHPELGMDYIRLLLRQLGAVSRDEDQLLRWTAEGRYPICLGCSKAVALPMKAAGVPVDLWPAGQLKEGGSLHIGNGGVALFNRAPHPNAAKVYINWLLSKEGQAVFSVGAELASNRVDVPADHVDPSLLPGPGLQMDTLESIEARIKIRDTLAELLKGR